MVFLSKGENENENEKEINYVRNYDGNWFWF